MLIRDRPELVAPQQRAVDETDPNDRGSKELGWATVCTRTFATSRPCVLPPYESSVMKPAPSNRAGGTLGRHSANPTMSHRVGSRYVDNAIPPGPELTF